MAEMQVSITGMDEWLRKIDAIPEIGRAGAGIALYQEAEKIMTDSKDNYVPVDTGALRDSGTVQQPETDENGVVSVTMGYGGPAAPYALFVHEIPAPPAQSAGGRSAQHRNGQWKYLETPTLEAAPNLADNIAATLGPMIEAVAQNGGVVPEFVPGG